MTLPPVIAPGRISSIIEIASREHGSTEVLSRGLDGVLGRTTWTALAARARKLAALLRALQVGPGDRVATLAWNHQRHLELYFAVPGAGAVLNTVHVRPGTDRLGVLLEGTRLLFYDEPFEALVQRVHAAAPVAWRPISLGADSDGMVDLEPDPGSWVDVAPDADSHMAHDEEDDERTASWTQAQVVSGAQGVVSGPDAAFHTGDVVLAAAPMTRALGWGVPYAAALVGARLVLPGLALDAIGLYATIEQQRVTCAIGPAHLWSRLLTHLRETGSPLTTMRTVAVGPDTGRARVRTLAEGWGILGVRVVELPATPPGVCNMV